MDVERPLERDHESRHCISDRQCGTGGPLGVVAAGDGCAEDCHDTVADVLVDRAAMVNHDAVGKLEEVAQDRVHILGV